MKGTYLSLAVVCLVVAVISLAGVSFGYTAYTVNSNNTATAEYVVLSQDAYSFTPEEASYQTYMVVTTGDDGSPVAKYNMKCDAALDTLGGIEYYGKAIGSSTIRVEYSLSDPDPKDFFVQVRNSAALTHYGLADLSDSQWRYILKITADGKATQYAVTDGSDADAWSYYINDNSTYVAETNLVLADNIANYAVTFYLAGPGYQVEYKVDDKYVIKYVIATDFDTAHPTDVQPNDLSHYNNGKLIDEAIITYVCDSTWSNTPVQS